MSKLLRKTASVMAIQVIYQITTFVNRILLTRSLSVTDFGILSIILLWSNFVSQFLGFGTGKLMTKEIGRNQNSGNDAEIEGVSKWSLAIIILLTIIISICLIKLKWIVNLISLPSEYFVFLILIAFSLAIYQWHFSIYNGFNKVVNGRLIQFLFVPISLLLFLAFFYVKGPSQLEYILNGFAAVYSIGVVLVVIFSIQFTKGLTGSWKYARKETKNWLSFSSLNFLTTFIQALFLKLDLIFINLYLTATEFALYSIAASILATLSFVNLAFVLSLESKISYFHSKGQIRRLLPFLRRNVQIQTSIVVVIYLIVLLVGQQVLELFGKEYTEITSVLHILCLVLFAQSLTGSSGSLLVMSGNLKDRMLATIIPGVIALFFYPLLIQHYGLIGVAVGYLVMISIQRIVMMLYVNKKFNFKFFYLN